ISSSFNIYCFSRTICAADIATIGKKDIRITAPDGTRFGANFVSVDTAGNGTPRTATYAIAAPNGAWSEADAGEYSIFIKQGQVADVEGNVLDAETLGSITINIPDPQASGDTIRIEAEDYKAGANGVEYFDFDPDSNNGGAYRPTEAVDIEATGDVDGGFNVGWIQDGEFLTYDVNVPAAGEYNIVLRVGANADNQAIEVVAGEQAYTANFNSTGGWQTYGDVIVGNVNLAAGAQEIRLNMKSSDFNFNYFELVPTAEFVDETAPTATLNTIEMTKQPDTTTPANFSVTFTDNVGIDVSTIDDGDVTVTAPDGTVLDATLTRVNTDTDGTPRSAI
ncbi:MAG: carbohydrate-binding protein, partial [Cyanobacteria bacterium J06553_1]